MFQQYPIFQDAKAKESTKMTSLQTEIDARLPLIQALLYTQDVHSKTILSSDKHEVHRKLNYLTGIRLSDRNKLDQPKMLRLPVKTKVSRILNKPNAIPGKLKQLNAIRFPDKNQIPGKWNPNKNQISGK